MTSNFQIPDEYDASEASGSGSSTMTSPQIAAVAAAARVEITGDNDVVEVDERLPLLSHSRDGGRVASKGKGKSKVKVKKKPFYRARPLW
jgi:hypothetical protein